MQMPPQLNAPSFNVGGALLAFQQVSHPAPYTLHPTPYILQPAPYTLHPTPYTLHPTP